jgi:uncharacterized repeat protein (TIGR01451 family)
MNKTKSVLIICLLLISMVIGVFPAAKANTQDSFGYTYKDSNTGGSAYSWIEINETGTNITPTTYTYPETVNNINIGFPFAFYGIEFNQVSIDTRGLLFFQGGNVFDYNAITNTPYIHNFIAPYWNTIQQAYEGAVYTQTLGVAPSRTFVIEWYDVGNFANFNVSFPSSGITFEAILYEGSNDILFQYKDVEQGYFSVDNGAYATVGIEDSFGNIGLQYSFREPIITSGLAILFSYPIIPAAPDLFVSINAPSSIDKGETITYDLFYGNLGGSTASDVTLNATVSPDVVFVSASEEGIYDSDAGIVTWNIGSVTGYPSSTTGSRTIAVEIPENIQDNAEIVSSAQIASSTPETSYVDNFASAQTVVISPPPPTYISVDGETGVVSGPSNVYWATPTAFQYQDAAATGVDIIMHINDGLPDIVGSMAGPAPTWTYTVTFANLNPPRHNEAVVEYNVHYPEQPEKTVTFSIYIDPAGYIYDANTLERISGASVWLQMPNGRGGWTNVPTGEIPAVMQPDLNPQITGEDGWYKWDTLPGTYRVHVEAPGYYSTDSIVIAVPPPVTDLHVGLVKVPLPQDNAPPIVGEIMAPTSPVPVNTPDYFTSSFADADVMDQHSAVWVWEDGHASKGIVTESEGVGSVTGARIYTSAGVYTETLTLTVTDSNGGSAQSTIQQYVVVYDPSAGFVTGGGWINSPAGAYPANPTLTGKANFGFVSKYQKGANVPSGNTEFDFRVAKLNFHGVSYDWLVIAGMKAQYKGSGTINGVGDYKFMLTAEDGGNQGQDTFRIKIWDSTTDLVVYDNGAQSPLGGGNIIVHK